MNAEDLTNFLIHWLSLQQNCGRNPWKHELQVPQEFETLVKEMSVNPEVASRVGWEVEVKGIRHSTPREQWRGWMAFMNYPLILVPGNDFRVVPRSAETIRLVQGG